jgi:hypothetical protein
MQVTIEADGLFKKLDIILREQAILGGELTVESWKKELLGYLFFWKNALLDMAIAGSRNVRAVPSNNVA